MIFKFALTGSNRLFYSCFYFVLLFLLCIFPKTVYATEKTCDDLINDDNDINILEENKIQEDTLPIIEASSFSSSKDTNIN